MTVMDAADSGGASAGFSRAAAVRALGVVFLLFFLGQLLLVGAGHDWYQRMFGDMSATLMRLRYAFSFLLRVAGAAGALGLLLLREWGRRLTVWLCLFSAAAAYWKHPYSAVLRLCRELDGRYAALHAGGGPTFADMAPVVWAAILVPSVLVSAAAAWFLTRPATKAVFTRP
jgi:hypothetical protein